MTTLMTRVQSISAWIWRRSAAAIALALIVLALIFGYRIGSPAHKDDANLADSASSTDNPAAPSMYTCSMHPTVRLPDPDAKCPICFMDLIPVTEDSGDGNEFRISISESAAAISRVETAKAGRFFPTAEIHLYGMVTYDETSVARLTAYFPGRIDRLFVNYIGIPVNEGDHLAELYSPDLIASFEELRQAVRAANTLRSDSEFIRQTTLDTLTASREKLRLFALTDEQIASIEDGSFSSDRLTIYTPINGVVTHLAVREGDYVKTGEPIATVADLSRLWLDLEAYESQLSTLRWGQRISFTVESHPGETFEGRISFIEPMVDQRTRSAAVRVAVDNKDLRLKPGMFASAIVRPRIAQDGPVASNDFAGHWVCPMHPTIVKETPGDCDICGMDLLPAESFGVVGDPTDAEAPLVIPRSAVLFTGTRSVVYVQVPDTDRPTYEGRQITLGPRAGEFYIVRDGLTEGESVVVNGAFRIDSAMQIAAKPSMMSPTGGAHTGHAHGGMNPTAPPPSRGHASIPDAFLFALKPIYAAYLDAQEGLADDDLTIFTQASVDMRNALSFVEETALVGEALAIWRRAAMKLRPNTTITTIKEARAHFEHMSSAVINLQRRFGHKGSDTWHLAHCPMAFDNKGANWLQRGTQINNPYFGDAMLRCGEIREAFEPIDAAAHEGHNHE